MHSHITSDKLFIPCTCFYSIRRKFEYILILKRIIHLDTIASQITSLTIVYSTVNSDANQTKYQSSAETGEFPAQMVSNAENVSIWWRYYVNDIRHIIHTLGMFVQLISICKCNHYLAEFINSFPLDKMSAALADDIFKGIFMNWNLCILIRISLKFVPKGPIDNNQHWFR